MGEVLDLSISGLQFQIHTPENTQMTDGFRPFVSECDKADWIVTFSEVTEEIPMPDEAVYTGYAFSVFETEGGFIRCFPNHSEVKGFYAVSSGSWKQGTVDVRYHPREVKSFSTIEKCFAHIGFEELLAARGRLILHASLVETPYGGILFSGPSGIGKSTQAELWHSFEGCTVLNGDRPILSAQDGTWRAYGSPYAGSSQYYVNRSVPVAAIVLLEQGSSCHIQRVEPGEAFRRLYAQTVVNTWNAAYVTAICELVTNLVRQIPVYRLRCTPDREAVDTLKAALEKGAET